MRRNMVVEVAFVNQDGIRIVCDGERWWVEKIRQLGEADQKVAEALRARAEVVAAKTPADRIGPDELLSRAQYVAHSLGLRITHRRRKQLD
jgi:predicted ATPase